MASLEDRRLLAKIAKLYYEEEATQSEIAKVFGVSRSLISKYLTKARELGIVEITINDQDSHPFMEMEDTLEKQYGLREVIIIPSVDSDILKQKLGAATSKYLLRLIKGKEIIGVSSGTTLNEVVKLTESNRKFPEVLFVPLVGGSGNERMDIHSNHIVAQFAMNLSTGYRLLHAPVMVDSSEAKEIIINQSEIRKIFDMGSRADIAIVGIGGSPAHSTMVKTYFDQEEGDFGDAIGDICYNFINEHGHTANHEWNKRVISLNLDKLKQIPSVIGVAGGAEKVTAIHAALKGKLVDVLITDEETAAQIIDLSSS
ncbi:sugar-binding transcriptional regulator [Gracilibacillus alcaliphilus]|uniref:sugar-binding transcriptional regulator n=1 Tax=Gracilibacillus alcaliphilus TaxID=1401441 RepID=UPI001958959F|nr:sugar-binding transcriptional regulator [Gracilibacillus alcaliphilus]